MRGSKGSTTKRGRGPANSGIDLARIDAMTDEDIARQIAEDPDVAPEITDEMFDAGTWVRPRKVAIALRVNPGVLKFFRQPGPGYQSRINAVLEAFVRKAERRPEPDYEVVKKAVKRSPKRAPRK